MKLTRGIVVLAVLIMVLFNTSAGYCHARRAGNYYHEPLPMRVCGTVASITETVVYFQGNNKAYSFSPENLKKHLGDFKKSLKDGKPLEIDFSGKIAVSTRQYLDGIIFVIEVNSVRPVE